jgi:hypothetical protein
MANFISFPLQIVLTGDGVSLNATVALAAAPTSVSLVSAYGPTGADVSSNIASVNVVGSSIVFTFNAVFTGAIAVEVALASANYNSLPLQPVAQITSPWIVDGSAVTQPVSGTVAVSNFPATQPVSLAVAPTTPVTGTFFQGTQPVSLATAPTTPVTGTFFQATQPVSAAALPLPTGAATSANQPVPVAKGTQGASATPTQDLKDSGRTSLTFYLDDLTGSSSEVLATMGITKGGAAQTAATSYTVTAGKILRLTSIAFTVRSSTNASEQSKIRVRTAASSIAVTSPIVINMLGTAPAAGTFAQNLTIPDGYEIAGGNQIAISHIEPISANSTQITVCLVGFEY